MANRSAFVFFAFFCQKIPGLLFFRFSGRVCRYHCGARMSRRRWLWLLLAVPLIAGLARLRFDVEVLSLLPDSLPEVRGLQMHQRHFANARELLITLQGDDAEKVAEAARALATHLSARPALVREARWQPPWLEHPADAAENLAWLWLQQPPSALAQMTARLAPENVAAELDAAREALASSLDPQELARRSYDPFGLTRLPESAAGGMPAFDTGTGIFTDRARRCAASSAPRVPPT